MTARSASRAATATPWACTSSSDAPDLQLLDVLGEVAAGHALVHVLVAGQGVELLDAGLDVVAGHPLAGGDGGQVDLIEYPLVIGDGRFRDVHTQFPLRAQHREPQSALGHDLRLGRPDRHHVGAGVPVGQDVGNDHGPKAYGSFPCTSSVSTSPGVIATRPEWPLSTTVACCVTSGRPASDDDVLDQLEPFTRGPCVVAFDAPLIVTNPSGNRPCEAALNRDFRRFEAGTHPANTGLAWFADGGRGARLCAHIGARPRPAHPGAARRCRGVSARRERGPVRSPEDPEVQAETRTRCDGPAVGVVAADGSPREPAHGPSVT